MDERVQALSFFIWMGYENDPGVTDQTEKGEKTENTWRLD
jgi:hypothetical protein